MPENPVNIRVYSTFLLSYFDPFLNPKTTYCENLKDTVDAFDEYVERLRVVQVEHDTWERIIDRYDAPDTLFYLDPPYLPETRRSGGYVHEMTLQDHETLTEKLKTIKGKVLMSGYANELYETLQWQRSDIDTFSHTSNKIERGRAKRTECLWRNYEIQPTLF